MFISTKTLLGMPEAEAEAERPLVDGVLLLPTVENKSEDRTYSEQAPIWPLRAKANGPVVES